MKSIRLSGERDTNAGQHVYSHMLIKLFCFYEKRKFFYSSCELIRNIGYALLLTQIIEPIYQFVMGIVLTLNNPHHRYASITLDQTNVGILLTASHYINHG